MSPVLTPARVTEADAAAFIARLHRHHDPDQGARWWLGCWDETRDVLCGVAVVGRPRAPLIPQASVVEVTRNCTDGTKNACSYLYQRAADVAAAHGFRSIITYTLLKEGGGSLRALGWWPEVLKPRGAGDWANRPGRQAGGHRGEVRWLKLLCDYRAPEPLVVVPQAVLPFTQQESQ